MLSEHGRKEWTVVKEWWQAQSDLLEGLAPEGSTGTPEARLSKLHIGVALQATRGIMEVQVLLRELLDHKTQEE